MARQSVGGSGELGKYNPTWTPAKWPDGRPKSHEQAVADGTYMLKAFYLEVKENQGQRKNTNKYVCKKLDGTLIEVWGNKIIDERMAKIGVGQYFEIEWNGVRKTKDGLSEYNMFSLFTDPAVPDMAHYPFSKVASNGQAAGAQAASAGHTPAASDTDDIPF